MNINPTALTISQLLGSQHEQYIIPAYQRRYSWKEHQVADLWDDIFILDPSDSHLLGTIVCLTGHHTAGINRLELVDGQQRLTTISILLYCLLGRLRREGQAEEARDLERLLSAKPFGGAAQPKIALDSLDAKQFRHHADGEAVDIVENARLAHAFECVSGWVDDCEHSEVESMLYKLKNRAIVIRLDVSEAKDAFKLFETINNRGLRLSATDIIKNFVLGNAARLGEDKLDLAREQWATLLANLDGISSETFFRQFMVSRLRRRVTQSAVVELFQAEFMGGVEEAKALPDREWYYADDDEDSDDGDAIVDGSAIDTVEEDEEESPVTRTAIPFAEFLEQLVAHSKIYREIVLAATGKPKLDRRLRNLRLIKAVQSYGFLMTMRARGCSDDQFEKVLRLTEAFLLRRHICRERTSDNETVFAKLCAVDPANPLAKVREVYGEYCPNDEKFTEDFATARFDTSLIDRARYCLEQIEMHQHGKYEELLPGGSDSVHVEHIIPQKIKTKRAKTQFGDWPTYLGAQAESRHPRYVSRIGNLTLVAGELNIGVSNNPYARKVTAYKTSAIKLTQALPDKYPDFRFDQIDARSAELALVAVKLWPMP